MLSLTNLPNQQKGEHTILFLRRHWLILIRQVIIFGALGVLPFFFYDFLKENIPNLLTGPNSYPLLVMLATIYALFIWLFFFHAFVDYYLDVWIVTNQRIINIEQRGLFSRIVSEQRLYRVQDITSEVHGLLPTLLHYGDIFVQTAGEEPRFTFKQVPHPYDVRKVVLNLVEKYKKEHPNET